jgi:pyruvate/2-oxoglutarate dehydrogenase complex dihydrolipoamide acyltransferase (E2) component
MFVLQARDGTLAVEDMDGGTFTISNGGVFGSLYGTPIINPPQSAILGMHGVFDRPVAINKQVCKIDNSVCVHVHDIVRNYIPVCVY